MLRSGLALFLLLMSSACTTDQAGGVVGQVFGQAANSAAQQAVGHSMTTIMASPAVASTTRGLCGSDSWGICHNMTAQVLTGFSEEFVRRMTQDDVRMAANAREEAIATGSTQTWNNAQSGASGTVVSQPAAPRPPAPVKVSVQPGVVGNPPEMEAVGEPYVVKGGKPINVRGGPGTTYDVVGSLAPNERIKAIAKVKGSDWYLVGRGDIAIGYASGSLLQRADLFAAPASTPPPPAAPPPSNVEQVNVVMSAECYTTTQTVRLGDGTSQEAKVTSCRTPNGWAQV
jgi:hypothetical protein